VRPARLALQPEVALKRVLHVGCGSSRIAERHPHFQPADWEEVRLDIDPEVKPDIVADITDMKMVAAASCDAVYSSHNLEHLYPHQVPVALAEFRRVLKPEGYALVILPDLRSVARRIADDKLDDVLYQSPSGPVAPLDVLYGFRPSLARGQLYMAHKTGFTAKTLAHAMARSGFPTVACAAVEKRYEVWAIGFAREQSKEERERAQRTLFRSRR